MSVWTPLNLEQSLARYLADQLKSEGYDIKWYDTGQLESVGGDITMTILREFPEEPKNFARQNGPTGAGIINVPAFSVFASSPSTRNSERMGIGESAFQWQMDARVDGFVDTELQWYGFAKLFKEWFGHPDIRVSLRDYESDLTNPNPVECAEKVQFIDADIFRRELQEQPAVRYYLNVTMTALFIE